MKIIHAFWSPNISNDFFNSGNFYLWVETDQKKKGKIAHLEHPFQIAKSEFVDFLIEIGIKNLPFHKKDLVESFKIILPSVKNIPLLSPLLNSHINLEEEIKWQKFTVNSIKIDNILSFLKEINFLSVYFSNSVKIGKDLEFWIKYAGVVRDVIKKDHYIPALKQQKDGKQGNKQNNLYPAWEIISEDFDNALDEYSSYMPLSSIATPDSKKLTTFDKKSILKQFSEVALHEIIKNTKFTNKIFKTIEGNFIEDALYLYDKPLKLENNSQKQNELINSWLPWRENIKHQDSSVPFHLCFKLNSADQSNPNNWIIEMLIQSKKDPSFQISLYDFWHKIYNEKNLKDYFGSEVEKNILILLGHATRIFPKLLSSLNNNKPTNINLTLEEAFEFLREDAVILSNGGYKVILPSWWSAKGQNRIKIKLKAKSKSSSDSMSSGLFSKDAILNFKYQLAMDDKEISKEEFEALVNAKESLVNFRGQWIEVGNNQMSDMLKFFEKNKDKDHEESYLDLLNKLSL